MSIALVAPLEVSVDAARRLQLRKQGIKELPRRVTKRQIEEAIGLVGCLQIDTINVVERAHYFTLWTRLGKYRKEDLHALAYADRRVFEGWGHAMCYMPWDHWRFLIASYRERAKRRSMNEGWYSRVSSDVVDSVLERIRGEGPLGSSDFEGTKPSGGWWNWKPTKLALEALFGSGELMVTRRDGFQRIYDLTDRVIPGWVDVTEPTEEERKRFFALRTLSSLGATKPLDILWYYPKHFIMLGMTTKQIQTLLDGLVEEGEVARLSVEGQKPPYYCLDRDAQTLEELGHSWDYNGVRFANYFDSLLWQADRLQALFGFERVLEVYLKPHQRRFNYFNTPILYGDRLVGRIAPKIDRKNKTLIIRGLWYEDWFKPDEEYQNELEKTLSDFAAFNGAEKIERSY